jgi:serine/threonine protein kinase
MTLTSGTKLGPYEILSAIGAGGMGEVYKARDTRLNRTVAIKVLPSHFSDNAEMKARFDREAQTIAGLNHPHICVLHDVGHQDGTDYLVMEYLEGQTLAQRLEKGALPLDEALKIAIAIADALDKAHRQGVVHRDLKPSNVMLTKSGAKLLDFGLAKLKQETQQSPTLSALPTNADVTAKGTILGTLQYMAPEQLEGGEADARTDIFAFSAMLYEMVTGKKAFEGRSQASLISAIMSSDPPPMPSLQPMTPSQLDRVVKKCLAKEPDKRWQAASDLAVQLQWIAEGESQTSASAPVRLSKLWYAMTALFILTTLVLAAVVLLNYRPRESAVTRFQIAPPDKTTFDSGDTISISPDGRKIAFSARDETGKTMLWVRGLDTITARPLQGTEGAQLPFWSPDSRSIGFFTPGKLKRIDVEGGLPLTICDTRQRPRGGTWNRDGVIVFAPDDPSTELLRVSAAGGEPVPVTKPEGPQMFARYPLSFLPDGEHFLFSRYGQSGGGSDQATFVGSLKSLQARHLLYTDSPGAVYVPPGYLLFVRQGTLLAQPFVPAKLEFRGEPSPIAEQVGSGFAPAFSVSENGTLAYRAAGFRGLQNQLVWVDRRGKAVESVGVPALYQGLAISPDGESIAVHRHDGNGGDIWIVETPGGKISRLTFDASQENSQPIWSSDGSRIIFGSHRNGKWGIYQKLSNGTGTEELLFESDLIKTPMSWSTAANTVLVTMDDPKNNGTDVWALPLTGDRKPFSVLQTAFNESHPQISPDGKWFAYQSNETGRSEIYVQSFPPGRGKWQISNNGGVFPRWRRDGKELFYMDRQILGKVVAVEVRSTGSKFEFSAPRPLFDSGFFYSPSTHTGTVNPYDVSSDGQRFLIPRSGVNDPANVPITVILNWTAALNKK